MTKTAIVRQCGKKSSGKSDNFRGNSSDGDVVIDMRLIDSDSLVTTIKGICDLTDIVNGFKATMPLDQMVRIIKNSPTIESEVIIRCINCKYYRYNNYGDAWCAHPNGLDGDSIKPTDFCCRAEERPVK